MGAVVTTRRGKLEGTGEQGLRRLFTLGDPKGRRLDETGLRRRSAR
jgi:hypothetical protein